MPSLITETRRYGFSPAPDRPINRTPPQPFAGRTRKESAMNPRIHLRLAARLVVPGLILLLAACVGPPPDPLRVGSNVWPGYEPLYLARELGYFRRRNIHLVELPSSTQVMHQLRSGNLEAACLTLDEVISQRRRGLDLQVVLVMDFSNGADVLLARPAIENLAGLRGKRIGVEHTAVGAILLDGALQAAGLTPADVKPVYLPVDQHETAWRDGRVDAVVTFEPVKSRLLATGARVLFDSSRIPGRIVDVLVVTRQAAETRKANLRRLLAGYFRARKIMRTEPDRANRLMAPRLGVAPAVVPTLFDGIELPDLPANRRLLGGHPPPLEDTARALARLMVTNRLLTGVPEPVLPVRDDLLPVKP